MKWIKNCGIVVIVVLLLCCMAHSTLADTPTVVTSFFDDFESHPLSQTIDLKVPPVGDFWMVVNGDFFGIHIVQDAIVASGAKALRAERTSTTAAVAVLATEKPPMHALLGRTLVFEVDFYVEFGSASGMGIFPGVAALQPAGVLISASEVNWRCLTGNPGAFTDSGVPFIYSVWHHIRLEMYDDFTWSMWTTPEGGSQVQVCDKLDWANGLGFNNVLRPWFFPGAPAGNQTYYDNINVFWIDHQAQGYPPINEAPVGIVIDGQFGATEWDSVKKVARKSISIPDPNSGSDQGNFKPWLAGGDFSGLSDDTVVDVFMAYDTDFFYVGAQMNNITSNDPGNDGQFAVYFANNPNSYGFRCTAVANNPGIDPNNTGLDIVKFTGYPQLPPVEDAGDPNLFSLSGGQIWYTVVGDLMTVEMKIPILLMPDFSGMSPGQKSDIQFNVTENPTTNRGTTNLIGEFLPWFPSAVQGNPVDPMVGIAFPICGDEDHAYPDGDLTQDCLVNSEDLKELANMWLMCTHPDCD